MDWKAPVPPIHTKVYHALGFIPITVKFGKFTVLDALSDDVSHFSIQSIFNFCTEEKICSYPVPCSFRTWLIRKYSMMPRQAHRPTDLQQFQNI